MEMSGESQLEMDKVEKMMVAQKGAGGDGYMKVRRRWRGRRQEGGVLLDQQP